MKKFVFASVLFLLFSAVAFAQQTAKPLQVTRFLGIPVDGSKSAMIQKLQAKGFRYNRTEDFLSGEFNGRDVQIGVVTNNNKVYRIVVIDAIKSDEREIINRFNILCSQFENNGKYVWIQNKDQTIPDGTDLNYEMSVNDKRYEACYYQMINNNTAEIMKAGIEKEAKELTKEKIDELAKTYGIDTIGMTHLQIIEKIKDYVFESVAAELENMMPVWFCISGNIIGYRIVIYYDNAYNQAHGEDL